MQSPAKRVIRSLPEGWRRADTVPMFADNRSERRIAIALPLKVDGLLDAVTRDVSPGGMYFGLRGTHAFAGTLAFDMALEDANMRFTATGTIVRVEHREGLTGVAVKLLDGHLAPIA